MTFAQLSRFVVVAALSGSSLAWAAGAASGIGLAGATLNGTVSSNGATTTVTFECGLSVAYGSSVTVAQSPLPAGAAGTAVSAAIGAFNFSCNTLYHYRVVATNSAGPTNGSDATFTTAACAATPATVTTGAASAIAATGATLNGTVSSNGASTTVTFKYGLSAAYSSSVTAAQSPLAAGAAGAAVSAAITGLSCNTLYHFRAVGANSTGTIGGADATFTTAACTGPAALTVSVVGLAIGGPGSGTVTSSPVGIDCGTIPGAAAGPDCSETYAGGTSVTLFPTPDGGSVFNGWSGVGCSGTLICPLSMSADRNVTATFQRHFSAFFQKPNAASFNSNEWVQKAYVAYYGRPADPDGLYYWATRMDSEGGSLASIIGAFGTSDEFNRRYVGLSFGDLVDKLYLQTLGRAPDPGGKAFYVSQLTQGKTTLQTITLDLLGGASGLDVFTVLNRLDVANHYTGKISKGCDYGTELTGVNSLASVFPDAPSASAAKTAIESRCGI